MKSISKIGPIFLGFILLNCVSQASDGWTPLFNGKDLSGWTVKCLAADKEKQFWTVADGIIKCDSIGRKTHNYVWLVHEREFGDFELRLKFRAFHESPGNSGLQFHSRFDESWRDGWMDGPQVDIHPPAAMPWRTGFIYDETREERRWIFPSLKNSRMDPALKPAKHVFKYADDGDGWNELTVRCKGTLVTTTLNGVTVTDWDGRGILDNPAHLSHRVGTTGRFALQLHNGDELRIWFKDIEVKELR